MTLRKKTITGIIWNFAEQIARKGIGVVITLLLARFLAPADFGLIAMMAVFLAIAQSLMNSGFKQKDLQIKVPSVLNIFSFVSVASMVISIQTSTNCDEPKKDTT